MEKNIFQRFWKNCLPKQLYLTEPYSQVQSIVFWEVGVYQGVLEYVDECCLFWFCAPVLIWHYFFFSSVILTFFLCAFFRHKGGYFYVWQVSWHYRNDSCTADVWFSRYYIQVRELWINLVFIFEKTKGVWKRPTSGQKIFLLCILQRFILW